MAELARRLWKMEQDAIRFSLREIGIPVVHWELTDQVLASRPGRAPLRETAFVPPVVRLWRRAEAIGRITPWSEGMILAVLALEALHRSRPWHTAVLGLNLLAWLLATHLAETAGRPAALRPHLPLIAAGLGLTALSIGATAPP
jgi:hypothetical protein